MKYGLAKQFRRALTPSEARLWLRLKGKPNGFHFRRQRPIGPYIVDFYCAAALLAIEVDGSVHFDDDVARRDQARAAWLEKQDVVIFRITAAEVMGDPEGAARDVLEMAAIRVAALAGRKA